MAPGSEKELQEWIDAAARKPFNPAESSSLQSIIAYNSLAWSWAGSASGILYNRLSIETLEHHEIREALPGLGPNADVLDLGGATGLLAVDLVRRGLAKKVISVDIAPNMTAFAREFFRLTRAEVEEQAGRKVELVALTADMTKSFRSNAELWKHLVGGVDVVMSFNAFSTLSLKDMVLALRNMREVLRPEGRIILNKAPPRPVVRHVLMLPRNLATATVLQDDLLLHRSTLVCSRETKLLTQLQDASFHHLAQESSLNVEVVTRVPASPRYPGHS